MILCELMKGGIVPVKEHDDDGGWDLIFPKDCSCKTQNKFGLKIKILLYALAVHSGQGNLAGLVEDVSQVGSAQSGG